MKLSANVVLYVNDNIRTAHLKCVSCKTQIFLREIEPAEDGGEIRTFGCPHCQRARAVRLSPYQPLRKPDERALAGEQGGG